MSIPFEPEIFGVSVNIHLILEYLAFFLAFRYYLYLRKNAQDLISTENRLSIILGAALGAYLGSRIVGVLENPLPLLQEWSWLQISQAKTIMGGLFGGLLGVEIAKKIIGEEQSSGDLFTLPIILGILIGRIGCFLSGTNEFTYGKPTSFFLGMDLGDGISRHPVSLYELVFLLPLFFSFRLLLRQKKLESGLLFKYFMLAYFGFRFLLEFLKPNEFLLFGLSSIQILCLICFAYYHRVFLKFFDAK